jgi:hypothetical protein
MTDKANTDVQVRKAFCSNCGGERNCEVRGRHPQRGGDDDFQWHKDWYILECRGCEHVFALTVSSNSEEYRNDYGPDGETLTDYIETLDYWPARSKRDRPDWLHEIALGEVDVTPLNQSLNELYGALDNDLFSLAGIGVRTTFDVASELLGVDASVTFEEKLDALVANQHIGPLDKSHIATLIDAGSASAHRGWRPETTELRTMMDVLESFILGAFVEPDRRKKRDEEVSRLKVPPRPARAKKKPIPPVNAE